MINKETELYSEVLDVLEWEVDQDGYIKVNGLNIIIAKKRLIKLDPSKESSPDGTITFRPLKNNRHVQMLVDFFYNECDATNIITIKEDGKYKCQVTLNDGEVLTTDLYDTETESKFASFYQFYIDDNVDISGINVHHKVEKKEKSTEISDGQKKTLKFIENRLGKKFTGKTFKGAQKFINDNYETAKNGKRELSKA